MEKIDMDKLVTGAGMKGPWRRPFGYDPRCEELKQRVKNVPKATWEDPAPERDPTGRIINPF